MKIRSTFVSNSSSSSYIVIYNNKDPRQLKAVERLIQKLSNPKSSDTWFSHNFQFKNDSINDILMEIHANNKIIEEGCSSPECSRILEDNSRLLSRLNEAQRLKDDEGLISFNISYHNDDDISEFVRRNFDGQQITCHI